MPYYISETGDLPFPILVYQRVYNQIPGIGIYLQSWLLKRSAGSDFQTHSINGVCQDVKWVVEYQILAPKYKKYQDLLDFRSSNLEDFVEGTQPLFQEQFVSVAKKSPGSKISVTRLENLQKTRCGTPWRSSGIASSTSGR